MDVLQDDYRRAIQDMDEKQFINIRLVLTEMRNHFATLHDVITKNIEVPYICIVRISSGQCAISEDQEASEQQRRAHVLNDTRTLTALVCSVLCLS
jgi:hypothetical protein